MRPLAFAAVLACMAAPVAAQSCIPYGNNGVDNLPGQLIVRYSADWSEKDHFNSSGGRLSTAGQVLQQDRANVHKFGRADGFDSRDTYFTTLAHRQELATARIMPYCGGPSAQGLQNILVNDGYSSGNVVFFRHWDGYFAALIDLAG